MSKPEIAQGVAEQDEASTSYWLLAPFKLYAYWWSFTCAYFSGNALFSPHAWNAGLPHLAYSYGMVCVDVECHALQ